MTDILRMNGKDNILRNARGMIPDALQTATDENQIQIAWQIGRIILHAVDQGVRQIPIELI